jgi:hypothetical protein
MLSNPDGDLSAERDELEPMKRDEANDFAGNIGNYQWRKACL